MRKSIERILPIHIQPHSRSLSHCIPHRRKSFPDRCFQDIAKQQGKIKNVRLICQMRSELRFSYWAAIVKELGSAGEFGNRLVERFVVVNWGRARSLPIHASEVRPARIGNSSSQDFGVMGCLIWSVCLRWHNGCSELARSASCGEIGWSLTSAGIDVQVYM